MDKQPNLQQDSMQNVQYHSTLNKGKTHMMVHVWPYATDTQRKTAQKSLELGSNNYQVQRSPHCTNLFDKLWVELQNAGPGTLRSGKWLKMLKAFAKERTYWLQMKRG